MTKLALIVKLLLILLIFLCSQTFCQPKLNLEWTGSLPDSVANLIDNIFSQWDKKDCPGCVLAISHNNKQFFTRGYGMANLEFGIAMSPATIIESGSVAKQFTAAAIVLLSEKGLLSLDDPIIKYLPELSDACKDITIRNLLNHTSGLRDIYGPLALMGQPSFNTPYASNDNILETVCHQSSLNFPPGTEYAYSNTGFILIPHIVQRITGKTFTNFTRENIFIPLGMSNTQWRDDFKRIVPNRAVGYEPDSVNGFRICMPYINLHGNGGLLTTVGDLLLWNNSFDFGYGEWRKITDQLQIPSKLIDGQTIAYGLGLFIDRYKGIQEIQHEGLTAGYHTYLARYPDYKLAIALLCNNKKVNTPEIAHKVIDLFIRDKNADNLVTLSNSSYQNLRSRAGIYRDSYSGAMIKLSIRDEKMVEGFDSFNDVEPISGLLFNVANKRFQIKFVESNPSQIVIIDKDIPTSRFTCLKVGQASPNLQLLQEYTGSFYSKELEIVHQIFIHNDNLALKVRPAPMGILEPTSVDCFFEKSMGHFSFSRKNNGKITGYEVWSNDGRCRHMNFVKIEQ